MVPSLIASIVKSHVFKNFVYNNDVVYEDVYVICSEFLLSRVQFQKLFCFQWRVENSINRKKKKVWVAKETIKILISFYRHPVFWVILNCDFIALWFSVSHQNI